MCQKATVLVSECASNNMGQFEGHNFNRYKNSLMMALKKCRNRFRECMTTVFIFIACKVGLINWNILYKSSAMKLRAVFPSETVLPNRLYTATMQTPQFMPTQWMSWWTSEKNNCLFILWSLSTWMWAPVVSWSVPTFRETCRLRHLWYFVITTMTQTSKKNTDEEGIWFLWNVSALLRHYIVSHPRRQ